MTTKNNTNIKQTTGRSHVSTKSRPSIPRNLRIPMVEPLINPTTNRPMANAYIIHTNNGTFLQSYSHIIAGFTHYGILLDRRYHAWSAATSRHRNVFLRITNDTFHKNANGGKYTFTNLNNGVHSNE